MADDAPQPVTLWGLLAEMASLEQIEGSAALAGHLDSLCPPGPAGAQILTADGWRPLRRIPGDDRA